MLRGGLLRELPGPGGGVGRPRIPLDLHTGAVGGPVAAGLHIGVPHATFSLVDLRGQLLARRAFPHEGRPAADLFPAITAELRRFLDALNSGRPLLASAPPWAVGSARTTGPSYATPRWGGAASRWPPSCRPRSDCRCGWTTTPWAVARAEILFGRPAARRSLVHLFIGRVVDAAFGIEGTVHQGPGAAAGDVAHLPVPRSDVPCACGRTGCLEATASDTALGAEAVRRASCRTLRSTCWWTRPPPATPWADGLLRERARAAGRAAALLLDVFDPAWS
ncbi:ROK family protein [Streptomyces avidinii]